MAVKEKNIKTKVDSLKSKSEELFLFFEQKLDYNKMVYEYWNAKDILGHFTYWHESFANNISDKGNGLKF